MNAQSPLAKRHQWSMEVHSSARGEPEGTNMDVLLKQLKFGHMHSVGAALTLVDWSDKNLGPSIYKDLGRAKGMPDGGIPLPNCNKCHPTTMARCTQRKEGNAQETLIANVRQTDISCDRIADEKLRSSSYGNESFDFLRKRTVFLAQISAKKEEDKSERFFLQLRPGGIPTRLSSRSWSPVARSTISIAPSENE
ncbi:hypothetical protein Tco_0154851 [Tanacetum coccineum]